MAPLANHSSSRTQHLAPTAGEAAPPPRPAGSSQQAVLPAPRLAAHRQKTRLLPARISSSSPSIIEHSERRPTRPGPNELAEMRRLYRPHNNGAEAPGPTVSEAKTSRSPLDKPVARRPVPNASSEGAVTVAHTCEAADVVAVLPRRGQRPGTDRYEANLSPRDDTTDPGHRLPRRRAFIVGGVVVAPEVDGDGHGSSIFRGGVV